MVIKYESDEFEHEVKLLLEFLDEHNILLEDDGLIDGFEEEVKIIDRDYELPVFLPDLYNDKDFTIGHWLDIVNEVRNVLEFDDRKFISPNIALFHIGDHMYEWYYLHDLSLPKITELIDGQNYTIKIVNGLTAYGIKLMVEDLYDKYTPAVHDGDFFIEITTEGKINPNVIEGH